MPGAGSAGVEQGADDRAADFARSEPIKAEVLGRTWRAGVGQRLAVPDRLEWKDNILSVRSISPSMDQGAGAGGGGGVGWGEKGGGGGTRFGGAGGPFAALL